MAESLRMLAGLGNPGAGYVSTRHNAGFWLVEALAQAAGAPWKNETRFHGDVARVRLAGQDLWLLKPLQFMNRSGLAVRAFSDFYKIAPEEVLVAHDDLDLPLGTARLKRGGGTGGHNGLRDVHRHLGTADFLRLRIGIGHPGIREAVLDYVLQRPRVEEMRAIEDALADALDALETLLTDGWDHACTQLHSK